jgi:hypothetical protein
MDNDKIIKYVAIAFGAYVVYVYVTQGSLTNLFAPLENLFGTAAAAGPITTVTTPSGTVISAPTLGFSIVSTPIPTINNGIQATVNIGGQTLLLSVIPGSSSVWDSNGTDISQSLQAEGVNTTALIQAMQAAYSNVPVPPPAPPQQQTAPPSVPLQVLAPSTAEQNRLNASNAQQLQNQLASLQTQYRNAVDQGVKNAIMQQVNLINQQLATLGYTTGALSGMTWMGMPVPLDRGWIN